MYSLQELAEHLKTKHKLTVNPNQIQDLKNIGYYHGYKGYRFIRKAGNLINFTEFSQIVDLNNFDILLKGLFYPNLMFIENALKSYVLDATLAYCKSEKLNEVYKNGLTYYKEEFQNGSKNYKKEFKKRMDLEMKINSALVRDYVLGKDFINHFYNQDREIPIWAVFESLSLGEFGNFYSCAGREIRNNVSKALDLPSNLDSDGFLLADIIFCLKDLRNAIAHNGIIFDTRFAKANISERVKRLLEQELKVSNINFDNIVAYVALVVYLLNKMGERKRCKSFIHEFLTLHGILKNLPKDCKMKIEGTQEKLIITALGNLLKVDFAKNLEYN